MEQGEKKNNLWEGFVTESAYGNKNCTEIPGKNAKEESF